MSVKKFALALTLGLSLVSLNAHADYSQDYEKCLEATNGVTADMLNCMTLEEERQDAMLNVYYKQLMRGLEPEHANLLKEAQRAWIKYRDARVNLAGYDGGSMAVLSVGSIHLEMTVKRVDELKQMCDNYLQDLIRIVIKGLYLLIYVRGLFVGVLFKQIS